MLQLDARPKLARYVDLADKVLRIVGVRRLQFTPDAAKRAACEAMGLRDFGDADFEQGLAVFCACVEAEANLDWVGRNIAWSALKRILSNRLLLVDFSKRNPDFESQELVPPIMVLGLPRTGSTLLHRLLAHVPQSYGPPCWEVWRPLPRLHGTDSRRKATTAALDAMRALTPSLDAKHFQDTDEPEECYHLLDPSMRGPGLTMLCPAWSYATWLRTADVRPAYRMYRQYLQIFQAAHPGMRLALKAPLHTPRMREILGEIPQVKFVQTHRDPVDVVASTCSLALTMMALTSPHVDPRRLGEHVLSMCVWIAEQAKRQREELKPHVVDVHYRDLVRDPCATVQTIYEQHGLPWTEEARRQVQAAVDARPQHVHGRHAYRLEDFGLSESGVREALGAFTPTH